MDFAFTQEQIELRHAVREFANAEIRPHVREWDDSETFPQDVIKKLGSLGYMG
jgi:alkylation response protein AidB-like acyl-CoA dehydrogenase